MSYKAELQNNNARLQDILDQINEMPEGGVAEPVLETVEVTPTGETFTVTPGDGVDGFSEVTVAGDVNLEPQNIAAGVTIYGVEGTLESGGGGSTFETSASGRIPEYDHGYADTELTNVFTTSATGAIS